MDYLPGQYGMHYERIGLNDYHYDSLGLAGHRPYYAFAGNQRESRGVMVIITGCSNNIPDSI